jgi:hypothetical protein
MVTHKLSIGLLVVAVAWYAFFALIGPNFVYPDPQTQAEVAADPVTVILALMRVAAPWVAAVIAVLAAVAFLREGRG